VTHRDETGSELPATTHLDLNAIQRTYLSYTRTVLAILLLGITILGFELRQTISIVLSGLVGTLVLAGVFAIWYARARLMRARAEVLDGAFGADRIGPGILAFMLALLLMSATVFVSR
jgi:uncharacterized membrane protein YidH (DUF202 family)